MTSYDSFAEAGAIQEQRRARASSRCDRVYTVHTCRYMSESCGVALPGAAMSGTRPCAGGRDLSKTR